DGLARRDPAQDPAGAIRRRAHRAGLAPGHEGIVVLASFEARAVEARPDLEALARGKREERLREVGLELVEDGIAPAHGHAARDAGDDAAERVALAPSLVDRGFHASGDRRVGATDEVRVDLLEGDGRGVDLGVDRVDALDPGEALDADAFFEELARDRARG